MKRKGGQRQRLQAMAAEEQELAAELPGYTNTSVLATFLLTMFSQGEFSPQRVQHIASLVMTDIKAMETNPDLVNDLQVMADLGSGGKYANKMHAELMMATSHVSKLPRPCYFKAKFKPPHGVQSQSLILPHEMFAKIYEAYKPTWLRAICPSQDSLEKFRDTAQNHPLVTDGHPLKERTGWRRYCVPFGLHGDGVPVVGIGKAWTKLLNVFSFFSLIGTGNTRSKMFFTYACFDKISISGFPNGTLSAAMKVLKWSFFWLFQGLWPDVDFEGNKHPSMLYSLFRFCHQPGLQA
eukprot:Skav210512  [mRNA]  locus=scaffold6263:5:886:- [translate_table: standard]